MKKLISNEIGISFYIQRHFHWSDNILFLDQHPELLDPKTTQFFLGGADEVINAGRIKQYLKDHGAEVGVDLHRDVRGIHGQALTGDGFEKVLRSAGQPSANV